MNKVQGPTQSRGMLAVTRIIIHQANQEKGATLSPKYRNVQKKNILPFQ
jgi:hypothetical protein